MTHRCFQCKQRFTSSGDLVAHMNEAHSSFVKDAQQKIDRSKELSASVNPGRVNTMASCPFCQLDCQTRKKLMLHLEHEHKDDDQEDEPEVKIIRLSGEHKKQFIEHINSQSDANSGCSSATSKPQFVESILKAIKSEADANVSEKLKVSPDSVKLPERRYKCFWCEVSFRKRGKLMDHIDMFHKANKHQIEMEAELLQGTSGVKSNASSTVTLKDEKTFLKPPNYVKFPDLKPVASTATNSVISQTKSASKVADNPVNTRPRDTCRFKLVGSIREISRVTPTQDDTTILPTCKFYCKNRNIMSTFIKAPKAKSCAVNSVPKLKTTTCSHQTSSSANLIASDIHSVKTTTSKLHVPTSAVGKQRSPPKLVPKISESTKMKSPVYNIGSAEVSKMHCSVYQPPPHRPSVRPMQKALFTPRMPLLLPPNDLLLTQQRMMLMRSQQSPVNSVQYLSYFPQLSPPNGPVYHNPDAPLDLSVSKF